MSEKVSGFAIEQEILSRQRQWIEVDGNLVVLSSGYPSYRLHSVLDRFEARVLDKAPGAEELDHFKSIIVVEPSNPDGQEELKVQSLWFGNGPWANMGAVFPELRPGLDHFQTLQGLLYPQTVDLKSDFPVKNPDTLEAWLQALSPQKVWCLTRLLSPRKQAHSLEQLIRPDSYTRKLGIYGIGDIGSFVAVDLRKIDTESSGIRELYLGGSRAQDNIDALELELQHTNIENMHQPIVRKVNIDKENRFLAECDVILVLVASNIPNPDETSVIDVRTEQYEKNAEILRQFIANAAEESYNGQILVASDPVEQLAMTMFLEMKKKGIDIGTHQVVGFGGMINRSRAKYHADMLGLLDFSRTGRTFGPHGKMVVAFPTHETSYYNAGQAEELSLLTGHANYGVRDKGKKPFFGPAALIGEGIRVMYGDRFREDERERIVYASPFLPSNTPERPGAFFGTRTQYDPTVETWTPRVDQPYLPQIMEILERTHRYVAETSYDPDVMRHDPFTSGENRHPSFHPFMIEDLLERVSSQ